MNKHYVFASVAFIAISVFFVNGGLFRMETVQTGVVHRVNVFTGDVAVCILNKGCKSISDTSYLNDQVKPIVNIDEAAVYTLSYIRRYYPQYKDLSDRELAEAMFAKFSKTASSAPSRESFFEVIGYKP